MEHQFSEQQLSVDETPSPHHFSAGKNVENDDLLRWFDVAGSGKLDDMKDLLLHGADVGWEDDQKRTVLHICAGYGYYRLVSLLLENGASANAGDENSTTALHLAACHGKIDVVVLLLDNGADMEAKDKNLETALHMAVWRGIKKLVQLLLHRGASINVNGYRSQTTLHLASSVGHKEVVQLLLYNGAIVDAKNESLDTALHQAAANGHLSVVDLLLDGGASINEKNASSYTALHLAASNGKKYVVELLLHRGATTDTNGQTEGTPLHVAARCGHGEIVQIMLDNGVFVDIKDESSDTALQAAIRADRNEVVKLLLKNGAAVDSKNSISETALHMAAKLGRSEGARILLSYGASVELENSESNTALEIAALNGHTDVLSLLITGCKRVDQKFQDEKTLLAMLSEIGDLWMVDLLLQHGADIEAADINGQTPLVIATKAAQLDMVSLLINVGADIEVTDNDSLTALHWSAKQGYVSILKLLLRNKAKIEAKTNHGDTALHLAAESNHSDVVATLIKYEANIDVKNEHGNSPIQVAIMKGHYDIITQLKNPETAIGISQENQQWLLYQAADVGQVELVKKVLGLYDKKKRIQYMNTALWRASQHGRVDVIRYLLDNGADIETCNNDGQPLLFLAGEHPEAISMLIHYGACIEARDVKHRNQSALHHYASLGQIDALHILWTCGCNVHLTDDGGNTVLHYAVENGHFRVAAMLLEQGVDINAANSEGTNALYVAVQHESFDLAKLLIDNGIDIEAKTSNLKITALHLAVQNESMSIISLLVKRHANVNAIDAIGYTPLHIATLNNMGEVCTLMIEHGAIVNPRTSSQFSPLLTAALTFNPNLVILMLNHGASLHSSDDSYENPLNHVIECSQYATGYRFERNFIAVVKLLIDAGASTVGLDLPVDVEERFPTLRDILQAASIQPLNNASNILLESSVVDQHLQENDQTNVTLKRVGDNHGEEYEINICNERWLFYTKHKYGYGLPLSKKLHLDDFMDVDGMNGQAKSTDSIQVAPSLKLLDTTPICNRAILVIQFLLDSFSAQLFMSDYFFMLELNRGVAIKPPKWASQFDKMAGIIREPGRLIVQIPQIKTSLSIPTWHKSTHPYLCFIDAVYVCRRSSTRLDQEVFSDLLGGSEQRLAIDLHAILIAGLSILSIVGGGGLIEKLVMAILGKLDPISILPSNDESEEWKIRNRRQCLCNTKPFHRPLSPVGAAKAIGIDIWRERDKQIVNRVWDIHQDKLVHNVAAIQVVFVTHRWSTNETEYQDIMKQWRGQTVSRMSQKLRRIRNALRKHTKYVWIDTICIDKSNLSELDEAIRSMYKWYASCAAVVLDSGTPLDVWCNRGWCLQEGAAAGFLCGISKEGSLVTIQQLAVEQRQDLCKLDLHLYYRPGNAAKILARMNIRKTTREEDMTYALAGIFDIHLTLAYGEGIKARLRLFHELATQKGDLSFLSFMTIQKMDKNYLPAISQMHYVVAECTKASTSITVSHFGICFEVQLLRAEDAKKTLQKLNSWRFLKFAKDRSVGIEELNAAAEKLEHQGLPVELAIVHEIRSLILVQTYSADWRASGGRPIKLCYRIQCCQIDEMEFERLFDKYNALEFEKIWLGDRPNNVNISQFENEWSRRIET